MRWLINYFRSCFCRHAWEREESRIDITAEFSDRIVSSYTKVSATCTVCGYHRSYKKF